MTIVAPNEEQRNWIHERYVGELLEGDFRDATRAALIGLVERLREEHNVDGVILGGTELPLLLKTSTIAGVPLLDTTALHVSAIVSKLRQR